MDYEQLKKKKMEEFQKKQLEEQQMLEAEAKMDSVLRTLLSDAAKARLGNVKLVNKELYYKAVQAIIYLANAGQLHGKIEEDELRLLLDKIRSKKEINIKRK
jgi:programmed cell death protein 5